MEARFIGLDQASLWTLAGRLTISILIGKYQAERFMQAKGQEALPLHRPIELRQADA